MKEIGELFQSSDWKKEKHVPVIEIEGQVTKDKPVNLRVEVGKEIPHPNTTEHHIEWIEVFFLPSGEKFSYSIGRCSFPAHGASAQGPNTSTVYTSPAVVLSFKTEKPGTLYAVSSCNIHGLWTDKIELELE